MHKIYQGSIKPMSLTYVTQAKVLARSLSWVSGSPWPLEQPFVGGILTSPGCGNEEEPMENNPKNGVGEKSPARGTGYRTVTFETTNRTEGRGQNREPSLYGRGDQTKRSAIGKVFMRRVGEKCGEGDLKGIVNRLSMSEGWEQVKGGKSNDSGVGRRGGAIGVLLSIVVTSTEGQLKKDMKRVIRVRVDGGEKQQHRIYRGVARRGAFGNDFLKKE